MSTSTIVTAFRIVSLPAGYITESGVTDLIENVLDIGTIASLDVQQRAFNGVPYHTAFVEMGSWTDKEYASNLLEQLTEAGKDTVAMAFAGHTFVWPNGKPMNHLSFKALDHMPAKSSAYGPAGTSDVSEWPLSDSDWKSLYIPCIPDDLSLFDGQNTYPFGNEHLMFMIEKGLNLGEVSRIDYVNQVKEERTVKTAYVHFKKWNDNRQVEELRNLLNTVGSKKCYSFGGRASGLFTLKGQIVDQSGALKEINRYLVMKINHKPIPEAPEGANAAQLSAANVYLENLVKDKDAEIQELRSQIAFMNETFLPVGPTNWDNGPMELSELDSPDGEEGEEMEDA
jgi:hypothetical protein